MNANQTTSTTTTNRAARRGTRRAADTQAPEAANAVRELTITPTLFANGALFPIDPERIAEMKNKAIEAGADADDLPNFPRMSGNIQDESGTSIPVSFFVEHAETGVVYASLSLGGKERTKYYGKLFRTTEGGPDYSGFIVCLPVDKKDQYTEQQWEEAPRLQVCGWRRRSANGQARISLAIAPRVVGDSELPL